ncbi:MAG: ABC transporter ATP-binding protein, partial [Solirubrobacteraceae bacterium]
AAADAGPVLRVRGLSVAFGGVHALTEVDLDVADGELVGLIGPNGAGKTTFIDAVTGFVRHSGAVELSGHEVAGLAPHTIAALGCARTWQGTDLFDDLDVRENLTVAAGSTATAEDIEDVLERMGLAPVAQAMPAELSEGQRKLVGLARAVVGRPGLLCLDEPAAGMDTRESQALGRRLRELADHGQSTLLIDHDMGLVLGICDRVVVLEFGRVIANGAPDVVRRDPAVMAAYLGSAAEAAEAVADPAT